MDYYEVAQLVPAVHRRKILTENHIYKAVTEFHDWDMMQLWFYYANFIEPGNELYKYSIQNSKIVVEYTCRLCLGTMLNKWKLMYPYLIKLEQDHTKLLSIQ